mmetsp:Transcript_129099/g.325742  ORF Transcript_129099/g.325742 Transcript_129099/m.325742 type:complete len:110 (-) Transcript_129099:17-346(-)
MSSFVRLVCSGSSSLESHCEAPVAAQIPVGLTPKAMVIASQCLVTWQYDGHLVVCSAQPLFLLHSRLRSSAKGQGARRLSEPLSRLGLGGTHAQALPQCAQGWKLDCWC